MLFLLANRSSFKFAACFLLKFYKENNDKDNCLNFNQ